MSIVVSLRPTPPPSTRGRLTPDRAQEIHQYLLPLGDELGEALSEILQVIDRHTVSRNGRTFVMLYPDQNRAVIQYLTNHSSRPIQAMNVWALCFEHLNSRTHEIMLRREEIAERLQIPIASISIIMGELKRFDAITATRISIPGMRGPGAVRYFMNPNVATHLSGKAREAAQAAAPRPASKAPKPPHQPKLELILPAKPKSRDRDSKKTNSLRPIPPQ